MFQASYPSVESSAVCGYTCVLKEHGCQELFSGAQIELKQNEDYAIYINMPIYGSLNLRVCYSCSNPVETINFDDLLVFSYPQCGTFLSESVTPPSLAIFKES